MCEETSGEKLDSVHVFMTVAGERSAGTWGFRWQSRYFRLVFGVVEIQDDVVGETIGSRCQRCRAEVQTERQQQHQVTTPSSTLIQ